MKQMDRNKIKYLVIILATIVSFTCCKELYDPDIDLNASALVVEGRITNTYGPYTIKLSMAMAYPYDSVYHRQPETGATVSIDCSNGKSVQLTENESGNGEYTTPVDFKGETGNSYTLKIKTKDGLEYESEAQTLLEPIGYDNIHGWVTENKVLKEDNTVKTVKGADIRLDLFSDINLAETKPYCRFETNIVLQYSYFFYDPPINDEWHWQIFGWNTFILNEKENITVDVSERKNAIISNHQLCFAPFLASDYKISIPERATNYIYYLRFDQYTINKDAYDFYTDANEQISAEGKIFDPVATQLKGNIKCTTDPEKPALGFFEAASVIKKALLFVKSDKYLKIEFVPYLNNINAYGYYQYKIWTGTSDQPDEPEYVVIPFPSWWFHK
jgi:hypothetical protein